MPAATHNEPEHAPARASRWIWMALALLGALALMLRAQGLDYLLPEIQEPDAYVVRQAELLAQGGERSVADAAILRKYPLLTARLVNLLPEPAGAVLDDSAPLEAHLTRAAAPTLRVRIVVALLALLAVPGTFLLARLWLGARGSLLAAAWAAVDLLHINYSQQGRPHAVAGTTCLLAVLAAVHWRRRPSPTRALLAGAAGGLALASLQFGLFALLPIALAFVLRDGRRSARQWGSVALVLAPLLLAGATCYLFGGDAPAAGSTGAAAPGGLAFEGGSLRIGSHRVPLERFDGGGFAKLAGAFWSYSPVALVLALVGLGALVAGSVGRDRSASGDRWVGASFGLLFFLVLGAYSPTPARFALPLVPYLGVLAACGSVALARRAGPRLGAGLALLALAAPLAASVGFVHARTRTSSLEQAAAWLAAEHDPASTRLLITPTLSLPLLEQAPELATRDSPYLTPWTAYQIEHALHRGATETWSIERALVDRVRAGRSIRLGPRSRSEAESLLDQLDADYAVLTADPTSDGDRFVLEAAAERGVEVFRSPRDPATAFGMGFQSRKRSAFRVGLRGVRPGPALVVYDLKADQQVLDGPGRPERERAALEALGYAAEGELASGAATGVIALDPDRSAPGVNLVLSSHAPQAELLDASGGRLHRWQRTFDEVWPEREHDASETRFSSWRRARLLPDGDLLAIFEGLGLIRLDARSELRWAYRGRPHHDLDLLPDGSILCLTREVRRVKDLHPTLEILDDSVTHLDPEGRVLERVSLLDAIRRSPFEAQLLGAVRRSLARAERRGRTDLLAGDVFHTNTLTVLDPSNAPALPGARDGDLLLCIRNLDSVVALDRTGATLTACVTGPWKRPHEATALPDGRLLVFDNQGGPGGRSRVFELDPASGALPWRYENGLASRVLGSVQRLPGGNTLITDSNRGRALEVTRAGERVWEYVNPHRAPGASERVARLFEVVRLPHEAVGAWASGPAADR